MLADKPIDFRVQLFIAGTSPIEEGGPLVLVDLRGLEEERPASCVVFLALVQRDSIVIGSHTDKPSARRALRGRGSD
jgi:hypothetical protein